jgi:hypothetical protein
MYLSLASPPNSILARLDVRTTLSKKFNGRNEGPCRMTQSSSGATTHRLGQVVADTQIIGQVSR